METNPQAFRPIDFPEIPGSDSWIRLSEVTAGDSAERKFYVKDNENRRYFLHIADCHAYDRKKNEYDFLTRIHQSGAAVPQPIAFGLCNRGRSLFLQTSWVYGRTSTKELPKLDRCKQYALGVDAALCLKRIHCCQVPARNSAWEQQQLSRIAAVRDDLRRWEKRGNRCLQAHRFLERIADDLASVGGLLAGRPIRLLHGGFHTENIILSFENSLSLIDLENWQYGDPLFDLATALTQIRQISLPCAIGVLDGYFAFLVSDRELRLLRFYSGLDMLEGLVQPERQLRRSGGDIVPFMAFMKDYQNGRELCPTWYKRMRLPGQPARCNRKKATTVRGGAAGARCAAEPAGSRCAEIPADHASPPDKPAD